MTAAALPDIQFDIGAFVAPAQTIDGILVGLPPQHTIFLTARLAARPSLADQQRMENALLTIETPSNTCRTCCSTWNSSTSTGGTRTRARM